MQKLDFTLIGRSPLLMNRDELANPLSPVTRAHKALTSGAKKTEAMHEAIAESEWRAGMYHDENLGPYVPGLNVERSIANGATLQKLGKKIGQAFLVVDDKIALDYDGPRDLDGLWDSGKFLDYRAVVVSRKRVYRARAKFNAWRLVCTAMFDEKLLNREALVQAIEDAGAFFGLCDFRPRMGKFNVKVA